jgi:hypothetical protein
MLEELERQWEARSVLSPQDKKDRWALGISLALLLAAVMIVIGLMGFEYVALVHARPHIW